VGVASARKAGLKVVGIARTAESLPALAAGAHLVVRTLDAHDILKHFRDPKAFPREP
jgi:hypothetical protein